MYTIEDLRKNNLIVFEHIRGSHLYNLNVEGSDLDIGGVYIAPNNLLYGFDKYYQPQVMDEKHDTVYYELGRWLELLCQSNPNVLESLFAPKDKIRIYNPILDPIFENKDLFLTKACFKSFWGYATEQIKRARGLNKKMVNPVHEKKGVLDFCYTFKYQGSENIIDFLNRYGLKQEYCGLVNVPNMHNMCAVFYDWGAHFASIKLPDFDPDYIEYDDNENLADALEEAGFDINYILDQICDNRFENLVATVHSYKPIGYRGIVAENSLDIRLSSVEKFTYPICHMSFNKDGYSKHCKQYSEYKEWEKNRNQLRYESNLNKNYDSKNMMHTIRLMHQAYEIATNQGLNLDRSHERDFLLKIKNHGFEYDELIAYCDSLKEKMEVAMNNSTIPENVNLDAVNKLLVEIRKNNE